MGHKDYEGNDYYCDVAIPRKQDIDVVYESDNVLAFHHTKPYCQVHIVVVPKKHIDSFLSINDNNKEIFNEMLTVIQQIASDVVRKQGAARILTNLGDYQDSKHLHFHVAYGEPIK